MSTETEAWLRGELLVVWDAEDFQLFVWRPCLSGSGATIGGLHVVLPSGCCRSCQDGSSLTLRQLTRASRTLFPPTLGSRTISCSDPTRFQTSAPAPGQRSLSVAVSFAGSYQS